MVSELISYSLRDCLLINGSLSSLFTLTPLNDFDTILTFIVYLGNPIKSSS